MVKRLDDRGWDGRRRDTRDWPPLLDHIGWRLAQAHERWKAEFAVGMVAAGHDWAAEARANVIAHIGREGVSQAELAPRMGLTKQAVQQQLDQLEADGVIERWPDDEDKRGRRVVFTRAGQRYLADANKVKQEIEARWRKQLGEKRFAALVEALGELGGG